MKTHTEEVWRKALAVRGRDWVASELARRPGGPQDAVLDVVFEQPYPTREFCQRWYLDQDNRMFTMSGHTKAVILAFMLLVAFTIKFINSWDSRPEVRRQNARMVVVND
ncbi:MAG TPA: hypothetical protein VGC09_03560 [Rhodopila sp.]